LILKRRNRYATRQREFGEFGKSSLSLRFSFRKLKKRAEKEKRREEKRKKKEAKKKRKQEEGQNSEAPNASEPDSLDGSGKRRPGRPPKKDKEPKIPKPRGRPPKDPLKRLEKERQLQQAIEQHKKEFQIISLEIGPFFNLIKLI
jgi:hypothetical protein